MPKFIQTDKQQNIFLPIDLSKQIQKGSFEYVLSYLIDNKIDLKPFYVKFKNDLTGRPGWDPRLLLKIVLFSYSRGEITSRKIQKLCIENITMIALAENVIPDFTVIADFITSMENEILKIFVTVLLYCDKLDLLGHTTFALDGCKMSSNASKEYSGTKSDFEKKKDKLQKKIEYLLETHKINDMTDIDEDKQKGMDFNKRIINAVKKINKKIKKIDKFLNENESKIGKRGHENKSNIIDNESAKMTTSHGVLQGYNGQALVDEKHQIIITAEVFGDGQDTDLLKPMLENMKNNMIGIEKDENYLENKELLADTGYNSENNLKIASEYKTDAYIPDQQFRKRDPRFTGRDHHNPDKKESKFDKNDFQYDQEKETYICPYGKILKKEGKIHRIKDWSYQRYIAKQKDCSVCPLRNKCLKNENVKHRTLMIQIKADNRNYSEKMKKKMSTVEAIDKYSRRMGIVEPVFANIRYQKRMNRFTLRGKNKVNIQWLLYAIVHNIEKIANYGDLTLLMA